MSRIPSIAARLLDEARRADAAGDGALARERLLEVLELDPDNVAARRMLAGRAASAGENKQLTIVFTDQVGSTEFVERHGNEITTQVFRQYHELFGRAVESHGGLIQSFQGDGIVACFGHPVARENDASRALDAVLEMMSSVAAIERMVRDELNDVFAIRVGVHSGEVVVAELGTAASPLHHAMTGLAPNIASRIQNLAGPNEIVVSEATVELVPDDYRFEPCGEHQLKGFSRPLNTYRLVGRDADRSAPRPRRLLSPMVGRDEQSAALAALWDETRAGGRGHCAVVHGAPGLGKSRLLTSLRDRCRSTGGVAIVARATDLERSQPLRCLGRALAPYLPGAAGERRGPVDLPHAAVELGPDDVQALNAILSPLDSSIEAELVPAELRRRSIEVLERWLAGVAQAAPVCLIVDDFHWADATTRHWIAELSTRLPEHVLVLVGTRTPEPDVRADAEIELAPLPEATARALVAGLVGDRPALIDAVVGRADGVPLFLEELAQAGAGDRIPATLREAVQAELEPSNLRFLAQVLATIGRTVPEFVLHEVTRALGFTDAELRHDLDALLAKGVIKRAGEDAYRFRHHLVWQAAYDSQLKATQVEHHGAVGDALGQIAPPEQSPFADLAGRQYLRAGRGMEGCAFLLGAVAQSQSLGAHEEGLEQLTLVEGALDRLPPEARPVFDVGLRMRRALSTAVIHGYADKGVQHDFELASSTSRQLMQVPELRSTFAPALMGLWSYYAVAGDFHRSEPLIADLRSAELDADWSRVVTVIAGMDRFFRGELDRAHALLASVDDQLDDAGPPAGWSLPNDPSTCGLAVASAVALLRGDSDGSDELLARALRRADAVPFPIGPLSAALTHTYVAMAHGLVGGHDLQVHHGTRAMAIGGRHGFTEWQMLGEIHLLTGRALSGEAHLAGELADAIDRWRATGAGVCVPALLGLQAELALETGDAAHAARLVDEGMALAAATAQGLGVDRLLAVRATLAGSMAAGVGG